MGRTRKFDGKNFKFKHAKSKKSEATKSAKASRKSGKKARITTRKPKGKPKMNDVWTRG